MAVLVDPICTKRYANWFLALGVINILLGLFGLFFVGFATIASVATLGALFFVSGVGEIAFAIRTGKEGNLWYHVLLGVLSCVLGALIFARPLENAVALTLLIAIVLLVSGVAKLISSVIERFPHWTWYAASGLISSALGFMILQQWPASSLWVIGVFVGCDILMSGLTMLRVGLVAKSVTPSLSGAV